MKDLDLDGLLPCALCGGKPIIWSDSDPRYPWCVTFDHDEECLLRMVPTDFFPSFETEADAIASWNRRAPDPRISTLEREVMQAREALERIFVANEIAKYRPGDSASVPIRIMDLVNCINTERRARAALHKTSSEGVSS